MRRATILIFIAVILYGFILFAKRPDIVEGFYLWLVGLLGPIMALLKKFYEQIRNSIQRNKGKQGTQEKQSTSAVPVPLKSNLLPKTGSTSISDNPQLEDGFEGVSLRMIRISDDGLTTIGKLYESSNVASINVENSFLCFTLEDTFREDKVPGQTRIPAGTYRVDFNYSETNLTTRYRQKYPTWFTYHLHVKDVPNFSHIYIHNGGNHKDTKGCVLVSRKLNLEDKNTYLTNSRETFKGLYKKLSGYLNAGCEIRLTIEK